MPKSKVETFATTGPDSESGAAAENLPQAAQAEKSLLDNSEPVIVRTVAGDQEGSESTESALIVNADEGDVLLAANGLPYEGVSADWVHLEPKD